MQLRSHKRAARDNCLPVSRPRGVREPFHASSARFFHIAGQLISAANSQATSGGDWRALITNYQSPLIAFRFATRAKTGFAVTRSKQTTGAIPVRNKNGELPVAWCIVSALCFGLPASRQSMTAAQVIARQIGAHSKSKSFVSSRKQTSGDTLNRYSWRDARCEKQRALPIGRFDILSGGAAGSASCLKAPLPRPLLRWPFRQTATNSKLPREEATNVSVSTATKAKRAFNFNAGPAALPLRVLEKIREEMLDYRGTGMSVMEMSHRSKEYEELNAAAEAGLRKHLAVPENYSVIFVQGGGSMQFTMVPMNLALAGKPVDVIHTGAWTEKAIKELKKGTAHRIAGSTEAEKFMRLPKQSELTLGADASYVYVASNNTIEGTQWTDFPETRDVPLVADMSSDILSRPVEVKKFGLIFAGAQKNLGPSGVTVVIVRNDLAERADKNLPTILQYRTHIKEKSLYHTPPTFAVYVLGLVMDWITEQGGVTGVEKTNAAKAKALYDAIDGSGGYYACPVEKASRSKMNVVFRIAGGDEAMEKKFAAEATAAGLIGLAGHRSVGGMRASIYNAVTLEAVEGLTQYMKEFQKKNG